jgi:hypothetical protein
MMLFSHGVESVGAVPISPWKRILEQAQESGTFLGVDERAYPRDFATFVRYESELRKHMAVRGRKPGELSLCDLDRFLFATS